jgi:hypothetical protein
MRTISRRALALSFLLPLTATGHAQTASTVATTANSAPAAAAGAATGTNGPALRAIGPQAGFGDMLVVGTGSRFELVGGAAPGATKLDGAPTTTAMLAGPWAPGRHSLSVEPASAAGTDGDASFAPPMIFVYDPSPPSLKWEIGDTGLLDVHGLDENVHRDKPPYRVQPARDTHVPLLWSPDGRRWLPVLPKGAKGDSEGALADWPTKADEPQIFLWALDDGAFGPAAPIAPKKLQIVRVWGADALSAVRELRLRVLPGDASDPAQAYRLELLATDLVGNQSSVTWPLAKH